MVARGMLLTGDGPYQALAHIFADAWSQNP